MYYKSGIFQSKKEREWVLKGEARPQWTRVGHTVLCYGWGESEDGTKYWLLQNSWGERWGENGHFKMLRGDDSGGIESSCVTATPYPLELDPDAKLNFLKTYSGPQ